MVGRLIEDQVIGPLGERPGDQHELFLTPDSVLKLREVRWPQPTRSMPAQRRHGRLR